MSNNRRFLYGLIEAEMIARSDDTEIRNMSSLQVAAELEKAGLSAAELVDRVRTSTDAMRKNAMIAKRMHIEKADVRKRAIILAVMAFLGLVAAMIALIGASLAPEGISEVARKLFVLVFVGGIGLLVISLLATLYVLWNAYVYKAILAAVATEETEELVSAISQVRETTPTITVTELVTLLRQNPIWERHNTKYIM